MGEPPKPACQTGPQYSYTHTIINDRGNAEVLTHSFLSGLFAVGLPLPHFVRSGTRPGKLRDVMVSLADEYQTVMVYSDLGNDRRTMVASFELPEPLPADEKFYAASYEAMLRWLSQSSRPA